MDGDTNIAEDEVLSESFFDGAGRVIRSRTPHTFDGYGATSTWSGVLTAYDLLGRVTSQSVPTEVNSNWAATGDDSSRGLIYSYTYYDWMGRTVRTVPSDSNGSDGKDTLITYAGCGCAGGLVTTVQGPVTTAVDVAGDTQTTKRRTQKAYEDILGRTYKTEIWDLDGGGSAPYSTVKTTFNGRDQATLIREYAGSDSSSTYQDTTMSYDGHGRVYQSHKPEQRDGSTLKYTTYSYNPDDSILSVTDGRGAVTSYTYNNRGLVTDIDWTPSSGGVDTTSVDLTYDNLGNRTSMTDGLGTQSYVYNALSQLTSETRDFSDSLADSPGGNGQYELEYTYHVGGQLKSYKDPWDKEITYANDKTGRLTGVTGTTFGGVSTYVSDLQYRAWGALKHLEYQNGNQLNATYNDRLQTATFQIDNGAGTPFIKQFDKTYEYYSDGRLKLVDEDNGTSYDKYDRFFTYDHVGRIKDAKSGIEAHGQTETDLTKLPFRQGYDYNALGNLTGRDSTLWNYAGNWDFSNSVTNNRVTNQGYQYDFDGRQTYGDGIYFEFDAIGSMIKTYRQEAYETTIAHDGAGEETKRSQRLWDSEETNWGEWDSKYFIRSTVLGRIVSEATKTGKKWRTFVIANGTVIARQAVNESGSTQLVSYEYRDASGLSATSGGSGESPDPEFAHFFLREELDGLGNNVGHEAQTSSIDDYRNSGSPADRLAFERVNMGYCSVDGIFGPCDIVDSFQGLDTQSLTALNNIFGHGGLLPIDVSGRKSPNRNNPMYIAREILKATGMFDPVFRLQSEIREIGERPEVPSSLLNPSNLQFNQLLGPNTAPDTKREKRLIRSSVNSALWRLKNMSGCKQFIQEEFGINPIRVLEDIFAAGRVYREEGIDAIAHAPVGAGSSGHIGLGNAWFDDKTVGKWVGTLNRTNMRTLTILHELKHLIGTRHPRPLLLAMGALNRDQNYFYRGIVRHCFGINIPEPPQEAIWPKPD